MGEDVNRPWGSRCKVLPYFFFIFDYTFTFVTSLEEQNLNYEQPPHYRQK